MITFLNPLDALIPKIPFSFFAEFQVRVTFGARGVSLSRILGGPSIEPFFGDLDSGFWLARPRRRQSRRGAAGKSQPPTVHRAVYSVPPGWAEAGSE